MDEFFETLRERVAGAARQTYQRFLADHPGERIYAFALYTDDGAMSVCAAANTEEAFAAQGVTSKHTRWSPEEWAYEGVGDDELQPSCELLADKVFEVPDEEFSAFQEKVTRVLVEALQALEAEGLFGRGAERERLVIFAWVSDSAQGKQLRKRSAQQLNPAAALKGF